MTLAQRYAQVCSEWSDVVEFLPRFVELCVELDAQHVIELGVRSGVSTVAWLFGLEQTGGRLTSVDIGGRPSLQAAHWTFIRGDDLAVAVQLERADIVFVDTSHHYGHTLAELERYSLLVNPGGRIVLHDTELECPAGAPKGDPPFPVKVAVREFCDRHGFDASFDPSGYGLAEIMVP